jgi:hypothetical protein
VGGSEGFGETGAAPTPDDHGIGEAPQAPVLPAHARPTAGTPGGADTSGRRAGAQPSGGSGGGIGPLPRRVRQANLAPQLKQSAGRPQQSSTDFAERDADEVRSRMASLQRGWQRGREENAAGDDAHSGTAPHGTTKGDGR